MKTIMKTLLVSIASLSVMFSVNAGELTVSGSAKATYNTIAGGQAANGIGVTNELNFTASGEMDNGYTWTYSMELDPGTASTDANGQANNDDTHITLTMGDLGTIKACVSECGNNKKYAFDQSAYTAMSDTGYSEGISYPSDAGAYASLQYHTPELPFGTKASIAYGQPKSDGQSGNATIADGDSIEEFSVSTSPIDGLTASASYYSVKDYADGVTTQNQLEEGGAYAVEYAIGNVTVGVGKSFLAPQLLEARHTLGASTVEYYENDGVSLGYAVNDDLTLSFSRETSERSMTTASTVTYDIEMDSVQIAYSLGGATLSIARADYENVNYTNGDDVTETIVAMSFAF